MLHGWQEEAEQSGCKTIRGAETSFCFMSVEIPADLHRRHVGMLLWLPLRPSALPFGYTSSARAVWEIQDIKKIQLASFSLTKYGMDEVALTPERFLPILTIFQCT